MSVEARGLKKPLSAVAIILSFAACSSACFAQSSGGCAKIVDNAALQAVNKIPVIGQTTVFGSPFAIERRVLRVEVDVFGPQTQVYSVDVTIDNACNVVATSTRLESNPENLR